MGLWGTRSWRDKCFLKTWRLLADLATKIRKGQEGQTSCHTWKDVMLDEGVPKDAAGEEPQ